MKAQDVMTTPVMTTTPDTSVEEVVRLLLDKRISGVPVVDAENRVVGIVSEGDLIRRSEMGTERHRPWWLRLLGGGPEYAREYVKTHGHRTRDVMTRPAVTVDKDASLAEIVNVLDKYRIKRIPVVSEGRLVGIISRADLLRGLLASETAPRTPTRDDRDLRQAVLKAINDDAMVPSTFLSVLVADGRVQIWGSVDTEEERDALRLAVEEVVPADRLEVHVSVMPNLWHGRAI